MAPKMRPEEQLGLWDRQSGDGDEAGLLRRMISSVLNIRVWGKPMRAWRNVRASCQTHRSQESDVDWREAGRIHHHIQGTLPLRVYIHM